MYDFTEILLDVWRESGRRIDLNESLGAILTLLRRRMPVDCLAIRRSGEDSRLIETVSVASAPGGREFLKESTALSREDSRLVVEWLGSSRVLRKGTSGNRLLDLLAPFPRGIDILAGPLAHEGEPTGFLILASCQGKVFEPPHARMMRVLLEPITAALENDRRIREIAVLREAAEAEKDRLLTRLGRSSLEDEIIGASAGLHSVMERVRLAALSDVPVLFLGETGTGKELMAREIHRRSPRVEGPILRVNCGAIPPDIIDSQLFGHEKGSFTGATVTHRGWFERADSGTLFLDEIGELPRAAQVRFLRILQDGWLERVGSQRPIRVDVRIIAATNKDLPALVRSGVFREDLWYRISTFPVLLPPLRERKKDIPLLAGHLAKKAARRFCLPVIMPEGEDMGLLLDYPWPGNVREMASVIDRAAILGNGKKLEIRQALGSGSEGFHQPPEERPREERKGGDEILVVSLDEAMRRHIESALSLAKGRVEGPFGAANILQINPQTLRARMKKIGVDWKRFRVDTGSGGKREQ